MGRGAKMAAAAGGGPRKGKAKPPGKRSAGARAAAAAAAGAAAGAAPSAPAASPSSASPAPAAAAALARPSPPSPSALPAPSSPSLPPRGPSTVLRRPLKKGRGTKARRPLGGLDEARLSLDESVGASADGAGVVTDAAASALGSPAGSTPPGSTPGSPPCAPQHALPPPPPLLAALSSADPPPGPLLSLFHSLEAALSLHSLRRTPCTIRTLATTLQEHHNLPLDLPLLESFLSLTPPGFYSLAAPANEGASPTLRPAGPSGFRRAEEFTTRLLAGERGGASAAGPPGEPGKPRGRPGSGEGKRALAAIVGEAGGGPSAAGPPAGNMGAAPAAAPASPSTVTSRVLSRAAVASLAAASFATAMSVSGVPLPGGGHASRAALLQLADALRTQLLRGAAPAGGGGGGG
ncbi:hypothetical protein TeGR_g14195, partial [Tetraparma gracilis]